MFISRKIPVIYYAVEYQTLPWQRIKKKKTSDSKARKKRGISKRQTIADSFVTFVGEAG